MKYYLIETSSRSSNSLQDGSDQFSTFYLTTDNPDDNDRFDRWIDLSESLINKFDAISEDEAKNLFDEYMQDNYDLTNTVKEDSYIEDEDEYITSITLASDPIDSNLYTLDDPDGATGDWDKIFPQPKENVEFLYGVDDGDTTYIDNCPFFDEFLKITEFVDFIKTIESDIDNINWKDIRMGFDEMHKIVQILRGNGYEIEESQSPEHLDPTTLGVVGGIYSYVFIRKIIK